MHFRVLNAPYDGPLPMPNEETVKQHDPENPARKITTTFVYWPPHYDGGVTEDGEAQNLSEVERHIARNRVPDNDFRESDVIENDEDGNSVLVKAASPDPWTQTAMGRAAEANRRPDEDANGNPSTQHVDVRNP